MPTILAAPPPLGHFLPRPTRHWVVLVSQQRTTWADGAEVSVSSTKPLRLEVKTTSQSSWRDTRFPNPCDSTHNSLICLEEIARKLLDFGEGHGETSGIKVEGKNAFAQTLQTSIWRTIRRRSSFQVCNGARRPTSEGFSSSRSKVGKVGEGCRYPNWRISFLR